MDAVYGKQAQHKGMPRVNPQAIVPTSRMFLRNTGVVALRIPTDLNPAYNTGGTKKIGKQ